MSYRYEPFLNRVDESYFDWAFDPTMNIYMGGLLRLENAPEPAAIRALAERMVRLAPRFREVPRAGGLVGLVAPPRWRESSTFDLDRHLRVLDLGPSCSVEAAKRMLHDAYSRRIEPTQPQWEWLYLHGLEGGEAILFVKIHHMYGDGKSLAMLLRQAFFAIGGNADEAPPPPAPARLPELMIAAQHSLQQSRERIRRIWSELRPAAAGEDSPLAQARRFVRFTYQAMTTERRRLGSRNTKRSVLFRRVELATFMRACKTRELSPNELFISVASRVVSRYYDRIKHAHTGVQVLVPIDLRTAQQPPTINNQISCTFVCAPRHDSPLARSSLHELVTDALAPAGNPVSPLFGNLVDGLPGPVRRWHARQVVMTADLVATNLGAVPQRSLGGSKISELYLIAPSMASTATFAFLSYADHASFAIVVNDGIVRDLALFELELDRELSALEVDDSQKMGTTVCTAM